MPAFELEEEPGEPIDEEGKVIVRLLRWADGDKRPIGEFVSVVQMDDLNDLAMKDILLENGFPLEFSDDALEEALRLTDSLPADELALRKDFRDVLTFTIDPSDAKDFDDALSYRALENGDLELGVHIADVSHFVPEHSQLDDEAYERATSVYLPDRVNPMLPERISNELCSLRPNEDKHTFSAVFVMDQQGNLKSHWLGKTVIHSNHRFTYEEVQKTIESGEGLYADVILTLNRIARVHRAKRFMQGAINFSTQEVRFQLDEKARPIGVVVKESKEAHQLIEEFMLLANRTVAEEIDKVNDSGKPIPFPYRVHAEPDEEKLLPFVAFARKFGYAFNMSDGRKIAESFNAMLSAAKGTPQQHVLEQLGIRTMAKAVYTTKNIGHYGLGFEFYCHFTSPIRRYPDVLVHRILQRVLSGKASLDKKLEEKCKHCSERERAAMDSERAANKYKQVEYLWAYLGHEFEAVISGVATFGFWAETVEHKCEGLVSIKDLNYYDDFRLVESDYSLVGLRSGRKFRMGDSVRIKVVAANLEKRQLDYEWVLVKGNNTEAPSEQTGKAETQQSPEPKKKARRKS
jgi:ribonuclease R